MKPEKNSPSTIDDIVFEKRNREYGAFTMRKRYNRNMWAACIIGAVILIATGVISFVKLDKPEKKEEKVKVVSLAELAPPPPIKKVQPPPPPEYKLPPPPKKTVKFVAPKITEKEVPKEKQMTTIEEVKEAPVISTETIDMPSMDDVTFSQATKEIGTGDAQPKIFQHVEEMPHYPGGQAALRKYLSRNLEYPQKARMAGIQGKVFVSFIVDAQGKITNIKIARGLTDALNNEVIRVIKNMPAWSPGKQNGKPVTVRFTLPVEFKIN